MVSRKCSLYLTLHTSEIRWGGEGIHGYNFLETLRPYKAVAALQYIVPHTYILKTSRYRDVSSLAN